MTLRIPDDLKAQLSELAEREHRSLNAQIVSTLDRALNLRGQHEKAAA